MKFKNIKKREKFEKIKKQRQKGRYKQFGKVYAVVGLLLFIAGAVLDVLYMQGIIFKEPLYRSPVVKFVNPIEDISSKLKKANVQFLSIATDSDSYVVKISKNQEILFATGKSIDEQISSLQLVLHQLTIEGKRFTRLDFRFDKPVILIDQNE